jgi:signal transduction histidine kinase
MHVPDRPAARLLSSPFLRAYRSEGRPAARQERVLAIGRAFLTVTGLIAIYVEPTSPARLAELTYAVLFGYAVYSFIVLAFVHRATRLAPRDGEILHSIDILWTAALTFVTSGPASPFFLFFLFTVLAAAYRWGLRETIVTTAVIIAVALVETAIAGAWDRTWFPWTDLSNNRTILRVGYFALAGFLVGYLAEQEKQARAEIAAVADAARQPRVELGLGGSVTAVARELLRVFDAAAVDFVIQDYETRRTLLWRVDASDMEPSSQRALHLELDSTQQAAWLFDDPGRAWHASRVSGDGNLSVRVAEPGVWPLHRTVVNLPAALTSARPFTTMTVANLGLTEEWRGRVYLFDARHVDNLERALHFLERLTEHITPALTNVFLLRRLRSRAGAVERARVARELHDGAIQALFGIEMKIEALRRRNGLTPTQVEAELDDVQDLLQREVLALRELMQALRPIELETSDQLPDVLASLVERFRRDTGVSARFVATGAPISLPTATALEVARIVQEALVNVRKHSRARNVLVRLTNDDHACTLIIEDDGQGFEFEGRLSARELERRRIGPAIIKERARIAGAELAVDSSPGVGARLELTFAEGVHA